MDKFFLKYKLRVQGGQTDPASRKNYFRKEIRVKMFYEVNALNKTSLKIIRWLDWNESTKIYIPQGLFQKKKLLPFFKKDWV